MLIRVPEVGVRFDQISTSHHLGFGPQKKASKRRCSKQKQGNGFVNGQGDEDGKVRRKPLNKNIRECWLRMVEMLNPKGLDIHFRVVKQTTICRGKL